MRYTKRKKNKCLKRGSRKFKKCWSKKKNKKKTFDKCWKSSRKLYKSCMKKKFHRRRRKRSRKGGEGKNIDIEIKSAKKTPEIMNFPGWRKYNNSFYQYDKIGNFMGKSNFHPRSLIGRLNRGNKKIRRTLKKREETKINQELLNRHHAEIGTRNILNKYTEGKYTANTIPEENMKRMVVDGIITKKKYDEIMKRRKTKGGKRKKTLKKRRKHM
jgi:hypothetical protein